MQVPDGSYDIKYYRAEERQLMQRQLVWDWLDIQPTHWLIM